MRRHGRKWTAIVGLGGSTLTSEKLLSGRDRKSTRLNSSHLVISYAVFCLKKKKSHLTHQSLIGKLKICLRAFQSLSSSTPSHANHISRVLYRYLLSISISIHLWNELIYVY